MLLGVLLLGIGVFARRPRADPPDPIYRGHRFSWWMHQDPHLAANHLTLDEIREIGPDAVRWLAYTADHQRGSGGPAKGGLRRRFDEFAAQARGWLHVQDDNADIDIDALGMLRGLGRDAEPAIPTLVRMIERMEDSRFTSEYRGRETAGALASIGMAAFPEMRRILAMRSPEGRVVIIKVFDNLDVNKMRDAERAQILEIFIGACKDPDEHVRVAAFCGVARICVHRGYDVAMQPAVDAAVDLLAGSGRSQSRLESERIFEVLSFVVAFREHAASALPYILELLEHSEPRIAARAAMTLWEIDPTDKRAVARMRSLLEGGDVEARIMAMTFLEHLGELPPEAR